MTKHRKNKPYTRDVTHETWKAKGQNLRTRNPKDTDMTLTEKTGNVEHGALEAHRSRHQEKIINNEINDYK